MTEWKDVLAGVPTDDVVKELCDRCESLVLAYVTKEEMARDGEYHVVTHGAKVLQRGLASELGGHLHYEQMREIEDFEDNR